MHHEELEKLTSGVQKQMLYIQRQRGTENTKGWKQGDNVQSFSNGCGFCVLEMDSDQGRTSL